MTVWMAKGWMPLVTLTWLCLLCWLTNGCVERRITILSDPPGGKVFLDGRQIGTTPVSVPFHFYGTREITVYKSGYEIFSKEETISPPLYQVFPLDIFFEFCWPFQMEDDHRLGYTLKPHLSLSVKQKDALKQRAVQMQTRVENP